MKNILTYFTFITLLVCSNQEIKSQTIEATYTPSFKVNDYQQLDILGTIDGKALGRIENYKNMRDVFSQSSYLVYLENLDENKIVTEKFTCPILPNQESKNNLDLNDVFLMNDHLKFILGYDCEKEDGNCVAIYSVEPSTLKPFDEDAISIDVFELDNSDQSEHATKRSLTRFFKLSDDSSSLLVVSLYNSSEDGNKQNEIDYQYIINIREFDINSLDLKSETELQTDVPVLNYELSQFNLTKSKQLILGFSRNPKFQIVSVNSEKIDIGPDKEDIIIYSGKVKSDKFERNGMYLFRPGRRLLEHHLQIDDENIHLITLFRDTIREDKKVVMYIPGYEIVTLNMEDLLEISSCELRPSPAQTAMCMPTKENIIKQSSEMALATYYSGISDIKKTDNGNWIICSSTDYGMDQTLFSGYILVARFDPKSKDNSWLRLVPKFQESTDGTLGLGYSFEVLKEDIFLTMNDLQSNISVISDLDDLSINGKSLGESIPKTNPKMIYKPYKRQSSNVIRIDKISEKGMISHSYIKVLPEIKNFLPTPTVSWTNNEGYLYILGLFEYDLMLDRFREFNFIKINLNTIK